MVEPAVPVAGRCTVDYHAAMVKLVVVVAMLLMQVQPLVGSVLCQRHHDQPAAACGTSAEHHPSGTDHTDDHGDHTSDEQCATTHACAAATPVISADSPGKYAVPDHRSAVASIETDRAPQGLRSPPFHPPKS